MTYVIVKPRFRKITEGNANSGENPGHPFRGNQYTSGGGSGSTEPEIRVGITSYRAGGSTHEVYRKMQEFEKILIAIPGVRDAKVSFGSGIYGGVEPTWVVSYKGNGKARAMIAQTAKDNDQDAVLMLTAATGSEASPMTHFTIEDKVTPQLKKDIVDFLSSKEMGMTWFKRSGKVSFFIASVPQFGNEDRKILEGINGVHDLLNQKGIKVQRKDIMIKPIVMTKEDGPFTYDFFIKGDRK
jgi:hypothetical protein